MTTATLNWEQIARAAMHPTRTRILEIALECPEVGPVDLAAELGEDLSNVSYHVKQLVATGLLEPTRTKPVRGTVAHYYRLVVA